MRLLFTTGLFHHGIFAGLCFWLTSAATAQNFTASHIFPQIGARGTEVKIRLSGKQLETAEEILFYREGITCSGIVPLKKWPDERRAGAWRDLEPGTGVELTFQIAEDAPLGEYYFRVRTRKKLSEMLRFWVTPFPVIEELHSYEDTENARNDSPEFAQAVPLGCTVIGYQQSGPANDIDCYRVLLRKGQRCTAQILNSRLGTYHSGGLTDMAITVTNSVGKRVARNDDSPLLAQDPLVSFLAPASGDYTIAVRQQMDLEGPLLHYALHISELPRPTVTYPLGGQVGETLSLEVFYLDGTKGRLSAKLPGKVGDFEASLYPLTALSKLDARTMTPNLIKIASFSNVFESHDHHSPEKARPIGQNLPVALNGKIRSEGETDWYLFSAKKGDRYRVRAYSRTVGSPLDPYIRIRPAPGNPSKMRYEEDDSLWDGHDWEGHHYRHQVKDRLDPVFMFEPDVDGEYLIGIGDTRREYGEEYVYRVEFQPHYDSIFTCYRDYPSQPGLTRDSMGVHRGSTQSRPIAIQNGFGSEYSGPIKLEAVGLPEGVTFHAPVFTKDSPVILATISVPKDTPCQSALFELIPHALDGKTKLKGSFAHTPSSTDRRGGYAMVFNRTRKLAFAVCEEAPFDVYIEQPKLGLAKNAELDLKVNINRKGEFNDAVYLEMDWLPNGLTKQPPLIIGKGETVGYYKVSATKQARAGVYELSITARENQGGDPRSGIGFHYIASPLIKVEVLDPYLEITLQRTAIEQGKTGVLKGEIKHFRKFSGEATARLVRLPAGLSLKGNPKIKPGDKTVTFELQAAPDALTGQYKEIGCEIEIKDSGQEIRQQSGDGVIRIDEKR